MASRLLRITLPPGDRALILDDLLEEYAEIHARDGGANARRWYWRQALGAILPGLSARWESRAATASVMRERRAVASASTTAREMGTVKRGEVVLRELTCAARGLRRSPAFTLTVVATLALGIGANAGLFDLVDRLFLQPPAFLSDPATVHRVYFTVQGRNGPSLDGTFGYPVYADLRREAGSLTTLAAHNDSELVVGAGEGRRLETVRLVTGDYWKLFDAAPAIGRYFDEGDDRAPAGNAVVVLSHAYWASRFAGDPGVLGSTLQIGSRAYTVIGVAARGFLGMGHDPAAVFVPLTAAGADVAGPGYELRPFSTWLELVARTVSGVSDEAAEAELTAVLRSSWARAQDDAYVERVQPRVVLAPPHLDRGPMRRAAATTSIWLLGTSTFLVLIACLNIANLLLARALHRGRELALRAALGGRPGRLAMSASADSLLLSALGGLLAVPLAMWVSRTAAHVLFPGSAVASDGLSPRVVAFAGALVPLTAALTSIVPWMHARRVDLAALISAGGRTTDGTGRARSILMVAQAALCAVLLIGTGLFARSALNVALMDLGYDADQVLIVQPDVRAEDMSPEEVDRLTLGLLERAKALPGVESAALSLTVPFLRNTYEGIWLEDGSVPEGSFATHAVSPGYFDVMGTTIQRGRGIEASDEVEVVVSASMARALWGTEDALDRCLRVTRDGSCSPVVGIAQDIRRGDIRDLEGSQYYVPHVAFGLVPRILLVRVRAETLDAMTRTIQRELGRSVPASVFLRVETLAARVDGRTATWRAGALIFAALGLVAVLLAALGLFSILWFDVARHAREYGIRIAMGSTGSGLVGRVVRRGVGLVALGLALGLGAGWYVASYVERLLFEVPGRDPVTFAGVAAVLIATAVAAGALPGVRAARVDPLELLRAD